MENKEGVSWGYQQPINSESVITLCNYCFLIVYFGLRDRAKRLFRRLALLAWMTLFLKAISSLEKATVKALPDGFLRNFLITSFSSRLF